ncbi:hypothetical protein B0I37DRAFT_419410 [Chaetomium sp. MPI-CAGE-AT-0009]|nr:hypothetical protein B0I37DRAFT_419410 [Chaetomium sp. MPI-CAGE-AT-0009]
MPSLPTRDFEFLPIPNTPDDPPLLTLSNSSTWTYCGPLLTPGPRASEPSLPETFHTWSAQTLNTSESLLPQLTPFLHAAHTFLLQQDVRHYWLTVRASQWPAADSDDSDVAPTRWHTDGHLFSDLDLELDLDADADASADRTRRWKLCATLQGPATRFAADGARAREALRLRSSGGMEPEADGGLEGVHLVVQPGEGEMVFVRVGAEEGAVLSEPRADCDRVVVQVVPGSERELRAVLGRYGMEEYPRSWTFGLPGWLDGEDLSGGGEGEDAVAKC